MPVNVIHFKYQGRARWGVVRRGQITPIAGDYPGTADFLRSVKVEELARVEGSTIDESLVEQLSPVTRDRQFVCQGVNYRQHDRIGNQSGHQSLQHDFHQGVELHRARRPRRDFAASRAISRL